MRSTHENSMQLIKALGNGNCAHNAFMLGFCQPNVLNKIDSLVKNPDQAFADFIQQAANVLEVNATWVAVKKKMLELRNSDKEKLQILLAPIMRKISISQARKDPTHLQRTKEPLLSAFNDYVHKSLGLPREGREVPDDIYQPHTFIQNKFDSLIATIVADLIKDNFNSDEYKELQRSNNNNNRLGEMEAQLNAAVKKMNEALLNWWKSQGFEEFMNAMLQDGKWAGDLELAALANYFHVNLDVIRNNFTHHMYSDYGILPNEYVTKEQVNQLVIRGVINPQIKDELKWLPLDRENLEARLAAVPNNQVVNEYIDLHKEDLKGVLVPSEWSKTCIEQLIQRNVIASANQDELVKISTTQDFGLAIHGDYKFISTYEDAKSRISEIENKDIILAAWEEHHVELSTVTLTNPYATHWDCMLPVEKALDASSSEISSTVEDSNLPSSVENLFTQTLQELQKGKIKPSAEKWKILVEKAKIQDEGITEILERNKNSEEINKFFIEKTVEYSITQDNHHTIKVMTKTQIELDAELAKQLQEEELKARIEQEKSDAELARQLQEEENKKDRDNKLTR